MIISNRKGSTDMPLNTLVLESSPNREVRHATLLNAVREFFNNPEININSIDDDLNDDERSKVGRKSIAKLEDGFSQLQYISDSSLFMTIKTIFTNYTLIEKEDLNFDLEEIKFKTQQYILKIESNMNSYPYAKSGPLSVKNEDLNLTILYKRNDLSENEFILQKEEVENVKYYTIEEIEELKKNNDNNYTFSSWDNEGFQKQIKLLKEYRSKIKR